ncbi:S8 family peptidase [Pirellulaceae bacterium SH449]
MLDVPSDLWPHQSAWEKCEKRLALSAMPWGPIEWEAVPMDLNSFDWSSSGEMSQVSHHAFADDLPGISLNNSLESHLSGAHQQTGWTSVQTQFGLMGRGQTVAVIDSGIAYNHVALGGGFGSSYRVVGGWDFAENDANPFDDAPAGYHGTHVAGIIGANHGTQQGVAPNVDFVALRTFTDTGHGQMAWVESALQWVYDNRNAFTNPITTVNLSLGATWNSSTIPSWATLEDELMRLNQVGIVVVASAGNSFQQNPTPGLAYPAASPYVIPVSSVDANGQLSSFSQRDPRVIAAPGRNVLSTVPDHFWGADGVFNDWARASGTSMAAPYVSGASVLIREAMELVGMGGINQQSIYNTLMNTANSIFDPITNQTYRSLNLANAIASIIPADEIGSTLDTGLALPVQPSWQTDSWINTLGDRDVFRLTAPKSGVLQLSIESEHLENLTASLLRGGSNSPLQFQDGIASISIVAGETFGIQLEDGQAIGRYRVNWFFEESSAANGEGSGNSSGSNGANFGTVSGTTLTILGTAEANDFLLDLRDGIKVSVDGATQTWSPHQIQTIVIDGGLNNDSIQIFGTPGADKVEMRAGQSWLTTESLTVDIRNVENVHFVGAGGPDRAFLYDQPTDDRLIIHPLRAELEGVGYRFSVENVNRIFVHALSGGDDQAFVYDSSGNDVLTVRPQFSSITGPGYFNYLSGFERVFAYSINGGVDRAQLYDSVGDDLFNAGPIVTSIVGPGFSTFVRGFSEVEAIANAGGNDRAVIHYSGTSQIITNGDFAGVVNGNRTSIARFFEQVQISAISSPSAAAAMLGEVEVGGEAFGGSDRGESLTSIGENSSFQSANGPVWADFPGMDFGGEVFATGASAAFETGLEGENSSESSSEAISLELGDRIVQKLDSAIRLLSGESPEDEEDIAKTAFFAAFSQEEGSEVRLL